MKWLLRNGGATYLRNVTYTVQTVQTVQYSDNIGTSVDVAVHHYFMSLTLKRFESFQQTSFS